MDVINIGPLALPIPPLVLLGSGVIGVAVGKWAGRSGQIDIEPLLWKIALASLFSARLAFVLLYIDIYKTNLLSMLDIRDGGFVVPVGLLIAFAVTAWYAWRERGKRKGVLLAVTAGASFWVAATVATAVWYTPPAQMPQVTLTRLDGTPVPLQTLTGKPIVLNLWATWCPPCRREMPVLRDAQVRHPDVNFIFANQGEAAEAVRHYLESERLDLKNVLLDARLQVGQQLGSVAMPTTLFFNAQGRLVDRRLGELSAATLEQSIKLLRNPE
ncbi:TlpA disulfide reductase family protein [Noviherbaspirillum sp. CPCC 100848]|uniref:TlpA disulfide reductase family protein n=1 Tax=Noviherbaspirillum album TaxID=3080276 RepID=A0ABU6J411_9BURK|nr:TlpA disulfide reductase family protein [Noviherbaspirillum sp. CPCC 100848]MEC4718374.1 TlpA disulfide reductase family protein [Noviherbaspirillum sp. CPCC 100848]